LILSGPGKRGKDLIEIYTYIGFDNPSAAVEAEHGYYCCVLEEGLELND